jgi:Fe2+ transport system protein FeoA
MGIVVKIAEGCPDAQRLKELGLMENTVVEVVQSGLYQIGGAKFAIGRELTKDVTVEVL